MERLTNVGKNGEIYISDTDETRRRGRKEVAYQKLKEYEDAEESGILLRCPCTIGTKLFWLNGRFILDFVVTGFSINEYGAWLIFAEHEEDGKIYSYSLESDKIGETIFFSEEDAEKRLKELEKKN